MGTIAPPIPRVALEIFRLIRFSCVSQRNTSVQINGTVTFPTSAFSPVVSNTRPAMLFGDRIRTQVIWFIHRCLKVLSHRVNKFLLKERTDG